MDDGDDLRALARRFVGAERGAAAFDGYLAARISGTGPRLDPSGLVDLDSIRFTENLLAGAIGAAGGWPAAAWLTSTALGLVAICGVFLQWREKRRIAE